MVPTSDFTQDPAVLERQVKNSFRGLGYPQLDRVECRVRRMTVYLRGTLGSFYLKQIAQTIAVKVPGVHQVVNEIEVRSGGFP